MNEQLQSQLANILGMIADGVQATGDFAKEQLPDVVQQFILYGRISSTVWMLATIAAACGSLYVALKFGYLNKGAVYGKGDYYSPGTWHTNREVAAVIGTIASLIFIPVAILRIQLAALVWFAPKVWLIKELAGMLP
jgi:hypothetical protein